MRSGASCLDDARRLYRDSRSMDDDGNRVELPDLHEEAIRAAQIDAVRWTVRHVTTALHGLDADPADAGKLERSGATLEGLIP